MRNDNRNAVLIGLAFAGLIAGVMFGLLGGCSDEAGTIRILA